jgi:cytochrome c peroxidase
MRFVVVLLFIIGLLKAEVFLPLPVSIEYSAAKAKLGKQLFEDPILSTDNTIACISCHDIYSNGAESSAVSTGIEGRQGEVNSPTVFNAHFNFTQFWDGRARTLHEQALGPITNPVEMGSTIDEVIKKLNASSAYRKKFESIYKDGVNKTNLADAIAEFEKALITPNSKFDRFLRGEVKLSANEQEGYKLFNNLGCTACHNGINIGGNMFQRIGVLREPFDTKNLGRYNVTKRPRDKYKFKVPSLRNVTLSAPYFHNGSVEELTKAIKMMGEYQLGLTLSSTQADRIYDFLKTLEGESPTILDNR